MKTNLGLYDMKKNNKNSTAKRSKNKETINNTENNTTTEEQSTVTEEEKEALLKQQSILNLSLIGIFITIYGILLSAEYINWQRMQVSDQINGTNYSENLADLSESPKITNELYLLSTSIFTFIIWDSYMTSAAQTGEARNEKTIKSNYRSLIAILLILLATTINHDTLNDLVF